MSFSPVTIDTSSAPADVIVSFSGTDDLSGIIQVMIGFKGPTGSQYNGQTNFVGTTSFTGTSTVTFPKFSAAGTWTIFDIRTFDRAGNVKFFTAAEIAALVHQTLTVKSVSDVTAPQLTSMSFSPVTIDTSSAPADVIVSFSGTDDLSGIIQVMIGFKGPTGSQYNGQTNFVGTTSFTGTSTVTFPKFSAAGTWTIFD